MSARQLIVLAVAAIAAIGALLIIRGMGGQRAEPASAQTIESIAGEQVLVVTRDIPQGAALVPSDLAVRLFPQESVAPQFVRVSQQPAALAEYVGAGAGILLDLLERGPPRLPEHGTDAGGFGWNSVAEVVPACRCGPVRRRHPLGGGRGDRPARPPVLGSPPRTRLRGEAPQGGIFRRRILRRGLLETMELQSPSS